MNAWLRVVLSALIALFFYAAWAYYANGLVTDNKSVLYKAALVQGTYSGAITLVFTVLLELFAKRFHNKRYCLPFVVPVIVKPMLFNKDCATKTTFKSSLESIEQECRGNCIPGMLVTPLPALALQTILVISINIVFETPNIALTVAPSIFFSAIYGYAYSIKLSNLNAA